MDKAAKTIELVKLISNSAAYAEASRIDDRTYELDGRYVGFHDVSTDGKFYGFIAIQVPNPKDSAEDQLNTVCELYTDKQIIKGMIKSTVIDAQSAARKVAVGKVSQMPNAEFAAAWDKLTVEQPEILQRLKTYEHIAQHIRDEWTEAQPVHEDGVLRLF